MSNHDSEDDFLNELYQQSALEKPPTELDKRILELSKARHQRKRFAMTMNLQRVLSVAAVMVLSVYIFFDVSSDRSTMLDEAYLYPPHQNLKSAQPASQIERLDMKEEAQVSQGSMKKEAKKPAGKEKMQFMSDEISELETEALESFEAERQGFLVPEEIQQEFKTKRALQLTKAEAMLKEINDLLALGKVEQAKIIYGQFKLLFPEYNVPKVTRDAIETEE